MCERAALGSSTCTHGCEGSVRIEQIAWMPGTHVLTWDSPGHIEFPVGGWAGTCA